jgi:hypothetical protein
MANKLVDALKIVLIDVPPNERKKLKPDPMAIADKWGKVQVDMLKKLAELEALDKSLFEQRLSMGAAVKSIRDLLGKDHVKTVEILSKLCMEHDRVFIDPALSRLNSLQLHTNVKI